MSPQVLRELDVLAWRLALTDGFNHNRAVSFNYVKSCCLEMVSRSVLGAKARGASQRSILIACESWLVQVRS
jgi:hypothetical protein